MDRFVACRQEMRNPARREIHVDQEPSTCEAEITSLGELGRKRQSFTNVGFFEIGKVAEQLFDGAAGRHGFDNHPYCYPHPSDAWFSSHDFRIDRDALEGFHVLSIARFELWTLPGTSAPG